MLGFSFCPLRCLIPCCCRPGPRQRQRGWRGPYSWTSAGAVRELTDPAPHEPLRWPYFTSAWWDLLPLETGVLCGIRGICQLGKG